MPKYNAEQEFTEDLNNDRLDLAGLLDDSELFREVPGAREALRGVLVIGDCLAAAVVQRPNFVIQTGLDRTPPPPPEEPEPVPPMTPPVAPTPLAPVIPPFNGLAPETLGFIVSEVDGGTTPEAFEAMLTIDGVSQLAVNISNQLNGVSPFPTTDNLPEGIDEEEPVEEEPPYDYQEGMPEDKPIEDNQDSDEDDLELKFDTGLALTLPENHSLDDFIDSETGLFYEDLGPITIRKIMKYMEGLK